MLQLILSTIGGYFDYIQFVTVKNKDAVNIHIVLVKIHRFKKLPLEVCMCVVYVLCISVAYECVCMYMCCVYV